MNETQQTQDPPVAEVLDMLWQGYSNEQIISALQGKGYSNELISEAINQAHTKSSVEGTIPPTPSAQSQMQPSLINEGAYQPAFMEQSAAPRQQKKYQEILSPNEGRDSSERIAEVAESIIEEKWQRMNDELGDLRSWKEKVRVDTIGIKQEIMRLETRFENLQTAVTGKIKDYDKGLMNIGVDIKALEKLLQNILTPLSTNVNELKKIVEKIKK